MKNLLRAYRSGMLTKPMTPEEVEELAAKSEDYTTGGLVGRRPAFTDRLAGMEMTLKYDGDGGSYPHVFKDIHSLEWTDENGKMHPEYYEAFEIDKDILMVAYLRKGSRPTTSCTIVLDLKMNLTTMIRSAMGTPSYARDITQHVLHGVILREGAPAPYVLRHHVTRDLVGRSFGWSYRDDMTSQHIFGSPYGISWVILSGPGAGLLGSAPCKYFRITKDVYLYTWLETMGSGQQGVVLVNLRTMHDCGTFYGINHDQRFEFYTYGARGYDFGAYNTREKFIW